MKSSKSLIFFILVFYFISPVQSQKKLVLEDIYEKGILQAKLLSDFRFLNDGIHYTRLESGVIKKYNILTGEFVSNIFTASLFKNERDFNGEIEEYEFSPQENKIIIFSESESVYRHSTKNKVFIYDLSSQKLFPVFNNKLITNPSLSPDEQKVAFVFENNHSLLYKDLASATKYKKVLDDTLFKRAQHIDVYKRQMLILTPEFYILKWIALTKHMNILIL